MEEAEKLYQGEFLAGFFINDSEAFSGWSTLWRERLHRQVMDAQGQLAKHYEGQGDYERACYYAQRQVELEPWREEAHQHLMRLLVRSGQRSAALQQYKTCRQILADNLDVEPSEDTQRLYRRVRLVSELGAHNLPPQVTPFVGREVERRQVGRRLVDPDHRLLTLVGPGGIGKTRLAIQVAYENRLAFLHGVCFVSLAPLPSAQFLVSAIAGALQLRFQGQAEPKEQLLDALRERDMLLLLDNFEHLIEDGTGLLVDVLQSAPAVKFLVTSRQRLDLYGETAFDVEGLELPEGRDGEKAAGYSAVDLFLRSADRAQAGFRPVDEAWADVVRICRLVGGMPLGIELAAFWVRTLSCRDIAAEIERNLAFLSATRRGVPPRHASIQAAFDHSWERLSAEEQRAFQKLAVFQGGFDREAGKQVGAAALATLSALVDKSFLNEIPTGRYTFHELMRQYAADKLAQDPREAETTHDDHCRYYAVFVDDQVRRFQAGQQREALDAIEAEIDNVRAAWQRAVNHHDSADIQNLMLGLYTLYLNRGRYREGYTLLEKATSALEQSDKAQDETVRLLGQLLWRQANLWREFYTAGERSRLEASLQQSVALLRASGAMGDLSEALSVLGNFLRKEGQPAEARSLLEESVEIGRQAQDRSCLARALDNLGGLVRATGDLAQAKQLIQESLAIHRERRHLAGMACNLNSLAMVAYALGEPAQAERLFLESKAAFEELGNPVWVAATIYNAGEVCRRSGQDQAAARYLRDALQRTTTTSVARLPLNILHGLAGLLGKQAQHKQAYELAIFVKNHPMTELSIQEDIGPLLAELESKLPQDLAAAAQARVRSWSLGDAVAEALTEAGA
ncbi:MAG: tetratricopeptide repeat protein [Thermoflexales bacterium]|nr:tetratricopeptide repeat protein [Thermoflexales bacterium]